MTQFILKTSLQIEAGVRTNVSFQTASVRPITGLGGLSQLCEPPLTPLEGQIQHISPTSLLLPLTGGTGLLTP